MNHVIDSFAGFGTGYQYAVNKRKEDEVKQGKNYYLGAMYQAGQLGCIGNIIRKVSSIYPHHKGRLLTRLFANIFPIISLPFLLRSASIKQGQFKSSAEKWNQSKIVKKLPFLKVKETASKTTKKIMGFVAEHLGNILRVAIVIGSIAIIILGCPYFGISALTTLGYEAIDHLGWVPRKISLFMETYLPIISLSGLVLGGSLLTKAFSLISLVSYIPPVKRFLFEKIDLLFNKMRPSNNFIIPTLKDINAKVIKKKNLSFEEINKILDSKDEDWEINPAHCSKWVAGSEQCPTDRNFDKLLTLYKKVPWLERYDLVKNALKYDRNFIDYIEKSLGKQIDPENFKKTFTANFDTHVTAAAAKKNVSKEKFVSNWMKKQMKILISVLKGKKRVKGSQQDLQEGINNCSKILPYLISLSRSSDENDQKRFVDALITLSIDAGDYCARGIKGTTSEFIPDILSKRYGTKEVDETSLEAYEEKIARNLQQTRFALVQGIYYRLTQALKASSTITTDVHSFDMYRLLFSLGFTPLTKYENKSFQLSELFVWEIYGMIRSWLYNDYQKELATSITENGGNIAFTQYIIKMLKKTPILLKNKEMAF